MQLDEKYFAYKGTQLYYFTLGEGPPLLFLPGGLRVSTYMQNIHYLSRDYKVIGLDLPGFGKSSTPDAVWALETYAHLLSHFIDYLKLPKLPVVGHSYGGGVGLYLSMLNRHVSKLVAFSPMGVASDHSRLGFYFNVLVTKTINDLKEMKSNRMRAFVMNNALSTVTENFSNATKMIQITNRVLYKNITPEAMQKITVPVKLMWAKHDELFPLQNAYYLKKHLPHSSLEILNGNHDWFTIYPERAYEKIKALLQRKSDGNGVKNDG